MYRKWTLEVFGWPFFYRLNNICHHNSINKWSRRDQLPPIGCFRPLCTKYPSTHSWQFRIIWTTEETKLRRLPHQQKHVFPDHPTAATAALSKAACAQTHLHRKSCSIVSELLDGLNNFSAEMPLHCERIALFTLRIMLQSAYRCARSFCIHFHLLLHSRGKTPSHLFIIYCQTIENVGNCISHDRFHMNAWC